MTKIFYNDCQIKKNDVSPIMFSKDKFQHCYKNWHSEAHYRPIGKFPDSVAQNCPVQL